MPDALRIGLLGPLQVRDEAGRAVHVGGRQLRLLLILLALDAGRVVPSASLAEQIWPEDPPGHPGNALQTLISRLRAELRRAGHQGVIESQNAHTILSAPFSSLSAEEADHGQLPGVGQSRWRELPNMISSQDGTEDRRPRAAFRPARPGCSPAGSAGAPWTPWTAAAAAGVPAGSGTGE